MGWERMVNGRFVAENCKCKRTSEPRLILRLIIRLSLQFSVQVKVLLPLFLQTLAPYVEFLDGCLTEGKLVDDSDEFCIRR
jgi:hypothetical protein